MLFWQQPLTTWIDRCYRSWANFIAPEFHWTNRITDHQRSFSTSTQYRCCSREVRGLDDTKKGSMGHRRMVVQAVIHAFCGLLTAGIVAGEWTTSFAVHEKRCTVGNVSLVVSVSVTLLVFARLVLAIGEAGNFCRHQVRPVFPKKDRVYATSLFNSGAQVAHCWPR